MNKGHMGKDESFAKGGEVLGRTKDFMKTPDRFRQQDAAGHFRPAPVIQNTSDDWGKGEKPMKDAVTAPAARQKSRKPILPRT